MKLFTLEEANRQLPYIRSVVAEILIKGQRQKDIQSLLEELEERGCYFKDWNFQIGLVDFPVIINGQEALLCWRSDEETIGWFHGFEDGYARRRPLTQDLIIS